MVKWRNKIAFLTVFIFIFMNFFIEAPVFADMKNATSIAMNRDSAGSAQNGYEKEPNNTRQTANKIQLNTVYKGALKESWDHDYYTFTLPSDGNVTFSMKRNKTASWYLYITDSKGNSYKHFTTGNGANATGNEEKQIGLPKGTYYVEIMDNQKAMNIPYEFQVKFQASNYFEKEFNDSFAQANSIELNKNYRGASINGIDTDYYSFSVDATKVIRIKMERSKESSWDVTLYDAKQKYMSNFSTEYGKNGVGSEERTYTLTKGKYYITVFNGKGVVENPYQFSVLDRSPQLTEKQIQVNNYKGKDDVVTVNGVKVNDVVRVYDQATGGKLLGSAKVTKGTQVSMNVKQLGPKAGKVYVSLTQPGMGEGMRTASSFAGEPTNALQAGQLKVVNNKGKADVITVSNVKQGSVVKVYDQATGGKVLGTATVTSGTQAVINVNQIGEKAGSVYVALTESGLLESARTAYKFAGEPTNALQANQVNVVNNKGKADVITVSSLQVNDVVKVYDNATGGKLLGTATVTKGTQAVVSVQQLGEKAATTYVTVTKPGMNESTRTAYKFEGEVSNSLQVSQVKITNNKGKADHIVVSGVVKGDTVRVYDANSKLLVTSPQATGTTVTAEVKQLGTQAGYVYVSVTRAGMKESTKVKLAYKAE
ncbi:pre-peptidase C-terminal domain-containing protein [Bacillus sp. BP-3]|uniref:pre-peptidase C-terminal domain-containing protein n=1 Tax=Bacillus sp. BP-3 TaxID=3022773 RepID=UPI00232D8F26|nr:pre-peptidase C-terminal domain-containing protein [Bacillus sp. BP-3]MDC2866219.1 pre-peptidase C-terminal domain-containing protein [Bacillus sp. BP-3]